MSKKKELSIEQLDKVTGGIISNCDYYSQAEKRECYNTCTNCRYFNQDEKTKEFKCTNPEVNKS